MATSTRGASARRRRENRTANLQWALLATVLIVAVLAAFVLLDGGTGQGGVGHTN